MFGNIFLPLFSKRHGHKDRKIQIDTQSLEPGILNIIHVNRNLTSLQ